MPAPLLQIEHVSLQFGGLCAFSDFNFAIDVGQLVGLIGPNGAGKTTAFNVTTGVYCPTAGTISLAGRRIDGKTPVQINHAGIARTFQNIRLFQRLSVLENVVVGFDRVTRHGLFATVVRSPNFWRECAAFRAEAMELLRTLHLSEAADVQANSLPYGDQRRLEIARALATHPKILLLDEPAAGMNPQEKANLMDLIRFIRDHFGVGIWLIEHDMRLVMSICQRITVLDHGETIAVGTPAEVQANPKVIEAYLGEPEKQNAGERHMLLAVSNLEVRYGVITALHDVSLQIGRGEIVTLIGANGAGKTTLLRTVSGLLRPTRGSIEWNPASDASAAAQSPPEESAHLQYAPLPSSEMSGLHRLMPHEIVRLGISHVPEGRQIFANLTVRENLMLGAYQRKDQRAVQEDLQRCYTLFPILDERRNQNSGTLSGGEQQMLAIGRALMARPQLLLLDEPSLGLAPLVVRKIFEIIKDINRAGVTIFLVEQNAHMALTIAHRGYVMQTGHVIMSADAGQLLADPEVKKAYLGG